MKPYALLFICFCLFACQPNPTGDVSNNAQLQRAFAKKQSNMWLTITAKVIKKLRDDNIGSRHQKFLVRTPAGQTVLIVHNIDLAKRIPIRVGDQVTVRGEYEWNPKGGLIHWTHHDPTPHTQPYVGGWIKHKDKTYE